jgi:hypothetical protein
MFCQTVADKSFHKNWQVNILFLKKFTTRRGREKGVLENVKKGSVLCIFMQAPDSTMLSV